MPGNPSTRDRNSKSHYSTKSYVRPPIHQNVTESEAESEDEEHEIKIEHQKPRLYPDLSEELKQRKPSDIEKKKKKINVSKQAEKPDYQTSFISDSSIYKYLIYIVLSLLFVIGLYFSSYHSAKKQSSEIDVAELVSTMQNHFNEQHPLTFKLLKSALKRVINEKPEPKMPAIFTIIANKGAENTASDFSIYLAKTLAPGQFVSINESSSWHNDAENLKFDIDSKINSKFEKKSLNVVVVDRFHNMPINAAMIFHGFCDHESAPFKRAVYLFIVHLSTRIPENSSLKYIDTIAMDSLRNSWRTSTDDLVDSLITRITVNVVNIR